MSTLSRIATAIRPHVSRLRIEVIADCIIVCELNDGEGVIEVFDNGDSVVYTVSHERNCDGDDRGVHDTVEAAIADFLDRSFEASDGFDGFDGYGCPFDGSDTPDMHEKPLYSEFDL